MSTILQSVVKDQPSDEELIKIANKLGESKCSICGEGLYIQFGFEHEHHEWHSDGWISQTKTTRMEIDCWLTTKYNWESISKGHWSWIGDYVFIKELDPEWQHKLHNLIKYNSNVHSVHLTLNSELHKFNNHHEWIKTGQLEGVRINWSLCVTNSEELARHLDVFYHRAGQPPSKCATFSLGTGKWHKCDWGYYIPEFRKWFYRLHQVQFEDIETVSETKGCHVIIKNQLKGAPPLSKKEKDLRSAMFLDYIVNSQMKVLFKKPLMRICREMTPKFKDMYRSKKKAERLLLSHLTHDERIRIKNCGRIDVPSKLNPNEWYSIPIYHKASIEVHNKKKITERLCYQLNDRLPIGDEVLAKYLACKFDEVNMRKVAVVIG